MGDNIKLSPIEITFIPFSGVRLLTDAQFGDQSTIALDVFFGEVVQQTAALTDHLVHAEPAVVILRMLLQVLGELMDALGQNGDLDLGGTGVALMRSIGLDNDGFLFFGDHVENFLSVFLYPAAGLRGERNLPKLSARACSNRLPHMPGFVK